MEMDDRVKRDIAFALKVTVWTQEDMLRAHKEGLFTTPDGLVEPPIVFVVTGGKVVPVTDSHLLLWYVVHPFYFDEIPFTEVTKLFEEVHRENPFAVRYNARRMLQVAEQDQEYAGTFESYPELYEFLKRFTEK